MLKDNRTELKIICKSTQVKKIRKLMKLVFNQPTEKIIIKELGDSVSQSNELRQIRNKLGLSQSEFGFRLARISQPAISKMELGFINIPDDIIQAAKDMLASYQTSKQRI